MISNIQQLIAPVQQGVGADNAQTETGEFAAMFSDILASEDETAIPAEVIDALADSLEVDPEAADGLPDMFAVPEMFVPQRTAPRGDLFAGVHVAVKEYVMSGLPEVSVDPADTFSKSKVQPLPSPELAMSLGKTLAGGTRQIDQAMPKDFGLIATPQTQPPRPDKSAEIAQPLQSVAQDAIQTLAAVAAPPNDRRVPQTTPSQIMAEMAESVQPGQIDATSAPRIQPPAMAIVRPLNTQDMQPKLGVQNAPKQALMEGDVVPAPPVMAQNQPVAPPERASRPVEKVVGPELQVAEPSVRTSPMLPFAESQNSGFAATTSLRLDTGPSQIASAAIPTHTTPAAHIAAQIMPIAKSGDPGPVEVLLNPAELGHLRFEIHHKGDQVQVILTAERPETLDLMRRNGDQLAAEFRSAGFSGASLSFGQWGRNSDGQPPASFVTNSDEDFVPVAFAPPPRSPASADLSRNLNLRL